MSGVLGDVGELTQQNITAKAVHELKGVSGVFHFRLADADGVKEYFDSHAKVSIVGPVTFMIAGTATSSIAFSVTLAVYPDKYPDSPKTLNQISKLQGSASNQHSLLSPSEPRVVGFGRETAVQLKPRTLVDYPPVVAGHYNVVGGTANTEALLVLEVPLRVDGVAHYKTW